MDFNDILSEAFDLLETSMTNKQKYNQAQLALQEKLALEQEQTKRIGYDNQVTLQDLQGQNNLEKQKLINAAQLEDRGLMTAGNLEEQKLKNLGQLDTTKAQTIGALKLAEINNTAEMNRLREKNLFEENKPDIRVLTK